MDEQRRSLNPFKAITTVLAAFSGIRRGEDSRRALAKLNAVQIVLAAVICFAGLVGGLIVLVRSIAK